MTLWMVIMWTVIALLGASLFYLGFRIPHLFFGQSVSAWSGLKQLAVGLFPLLGLMALITFCLDFVNGIVCVLYLALIWLASDVVFWMLEKVGHFSFAHYYAGWLAVVATILSLTAGWYYAHHVSLTKYELTTPKVMEDLRVVMFADAHMGTMFDAKGFIKHVKAMQDQNPDIVVVVGDFVDDGTTRDEMVQAVQALGKMKTKYGVYFVFGNHDKGYYGAKHRGFSANDLVQELIQNGVQVLRDEAVLLHDNFYIVGRKDYSETAENRGKRQSMAEIVQDLNRDKYMIVLDHQPTEFEKQAEAKVDLVLCGHTHGGQLFPFNQVGKWIGANDLVYGYEKRKQTDFIVTSGLAAWAIRFKTGTKSEFVVIDIKQK